MSAKLLRSITNNYFLRAAILMTPILIAYYGEQILAFHGNHFASAFWRVYPALMAAAAIWFLFYRLLWHYMYQVYDRRGDWKYDAKEATDALLHNIVDYAESKNDATRAFVIAALGFYFSYLFIVMDVETSYNLPFPLVMTTLIFSSALFVTSFLLQSGMNLYSQVAKPLFQLITAAHAVNKSLQTVTGEFDKSPDKFDSLKEDWGQYSTVDDRLITSILDRATRRNGQRVM